jgi:hypothetical protein
MDLCKAGKAKALVTRLVLREADRNIQAKFDDSTLTRFYNLLAELDPEIVPIPDPDEIEAATIVVAEKNAHVVAGARVSNATHLITLDRKHFHSTEQRQAFLPIIACTLGEYLQALLSDLS